MLAETMTRELDVRRQNRNKGFSLVELIIVIAIMIVLIAILAPQFLKYVESSRVAKDETVADELFRTIQTAVANQHVYDTLISGANRVQLNGLTGELTFPAGFGTPAGTDKGAMLAEINSVLDVAKLKWVSNTHKTTANQQAYTVTVDVGALGASGIPITVTATFTSITT
ncbi:hypothetical protein FACS1894208_03380 [Clostridia bacterium]|nr:hypothetical protein FACS1894208_03380 [Clostridia bacterium]